MQLMAVAKCVLAVEIGMGELKLTMPISSVLRNTCLCSERSATCQPVHVVFRCTSTEIFVVAICGWRVTEGNSPDIKRWLLQTSAPDLMMGSLR